MPALNEADVIGNVIDQIPRDFQYAAKVTILVIDDGSTDATRKIALEHNAVVYSHPVNRGLGTAFSSATEQALNMGADILVSIDADGQFNPMEIPQLVEPIAQKRCDFTLGNRFANCKRPTGMPVPRFLGNQIMNTVLSLLVRRQISDASCGFRAYSRNTLLRLNPVERFTYTHETLLELHAKGLLCEQIPISVRYFPGRKSILTRSLFMYGTRALLIIVRFLRDYRPTLFFGGVGVLCAIVSVGLAIVPITNFLLYDSFTPYKTLGVMSLFFASLGIASVFVGFLADSNARQRMLLENLLYLQRAQIFNTHAANNSQSRSNT
jgi:glycosyltransferase involved in cell wall biosynthesis